MFPSWSQGKIWELRQDLWTIAAASNRAMGNLQGTYGVTPQQGVREARPEAATPRQEGLAIPDWMIHEGHAFVRNTVIRDSRGQAVGYYKCWKAGKTKEDGCPVRLVYRPDRGECVEGREAHKYDACAAECFLEARNKAGLMEEVKAWVVAQSLTTKTPREIFEEYRGMYMDQRRRGVPSAGFSHEQLTRWVSAERRSRQGVPDFAQQLALVDDPTDVRVKHSWLRSEVFAPAPMLVFAMDRQLEKLLTCDIWLVDGTFRAAPQGFKQILNIMGVQIGVNSITYFPGAHIFMPGQKAEDYRLATMQFLGLFRGRRPQVKRLVLDFEEAEWDGIGNTVHGALPACHVQGCLFHYAQALLRMFSKLFRCTAPGRPKSPVDQLAFRVLNLLMWAPYVDLRMVLVQALQVHATGPLAQFVAYYEKRWMATEKRWHLDPWAFEMDVFTNCALEGYHGHIGEHLQYRHQSLVPTAMQFFKMDWHWLETRDFNALVPGHAERAETRFQRFQRTQDVILLRYQTVVEEVSRTPLQPIFKGPVATDDAGETTRQDMETVDEVMDNYSADPEQFLNRLDALANEA